jgi:hypothetical protein
MRVKIIEAIRACSSQVANRKSGLNRNDDRKDAEHEDDDCEGCR